MTAHRTNAPARHGDDTSPAPQLGALPRDGFVDRGPAPLALRVESAAADEVGVDEAAARGTRKQIGAHHGLERLRRRGGVDKFAGGAMLAPRCVIGFKPIA